MPKVSTVAAYAFPATGAALVVIVQTPPDVARSNAAKWVKELVGIIPDWPPWVDHVLTAIGVSLIAIGLLLAVKLVLSQLDDPPAPEEAPEEIAPSPYVPNDREKSALKAMDDFLKDRVEPFLRRGQIVAPWAQCVRSSKNRTEAWGKLYGFRYHLLPLATDLADLERRNRDEFDALGISPNDMLLCIEALARPVETLYRPVWKMTIFRVPLTKPPIEHFPGQEEDLKKAVQRFEDSVSQFRAKIEPLLGHLTEAE
jgi:hypothetical protein